MSDIITSKNLDEVIEKNLKIKDDVTYYKDRLLNDLNLNNAVKAEEKLAFQILKDKGLRTGNITYQINDELLPNTIIDQLPRENEVVTTQKDVDLFISQTPDTTNYKPERKK